MNRKKNTQIFEEKASSAHIPCPRCGGSGMVASQAVTMGDRFRAGRMKINKTQAQLSQIIQTSRGQIANIESDTHKPSIETLLRAADAFGVSIDYLVGRD